MEASSRAVGRETRPKIARNAATNVIREVRERFGHTEAVIDAFAILGASSCYAARLPVTAALREA